MVEGAVGFHCPECVKSAPQPKVKVRRLAASQLTSVVIIAINVVVFLAIFFTGRQESPLVPILALTPEGACVGAGQIWLTDPTGCAAAGYSWEPGVATGALWQLITSAFVHIDVWHIGFNMLALFLLGPQVERVLGRARFLAIYLLSALVGSAFVVAFSPPFQSTLGASGAVFGLIGALLLLAWRYGGNARGILMWLGLNIVFTFAVPTVSWQGHLGGLFGGLVLTALLGLLPSSWHRYRWWFVGAFTLLVCGAIAALILL